MTHKDLCTARHRRPSCYLAGKRAQSAGVSARGSAGRGGNSCRGDITHTHVAFQGQHLVAVVTGGQVSLNTRILTLFSCGTCAPGARTRSRACICPVGHSSTRAAADGVAHAHTRHANSSTLLPERHEAARLASGARSGGWVNGTSLGWLLLWIHSGRGVRASGNVDGEQARQIERRWRRRVGRRWRGGGRGQAVERQRKSRTGWAHAPLHR